MIEAIKRALFKRKILREIREQIWSAEINGEYNSYILEEVGKLREKQLKHIEEKQAEIDAIADSSEHHKKEKREELQKLVNEKKGLENGLKHIQDKAANCLHSLNAEQDKYTDRKKKLKYFSENFKIWNSKKAKGAQGAELVPLN